MRSIWRLRSAAIAFLPVLFTVLTLAPVAGAFHLGIGLVVLGAAVSVTARSRDGDRPAPDVSPDADRRARTAARVGAVVTVGAVRVLATVLGVAGLALLFSVSLLVGDVVYVALLLGLRLVGRWGPRWAGLARAALLPLTAVFVVPPVTMTGSPVARLGWAAAACLVASLWTVAVAVALPSPKPSPGTVIRAARRATREALAQPSPAVASSASNDARLPPGAPPAKNSGRLAAAALELDRAMPVNTPARRALFQVEHAV